jgi:hypothetical protein
VIEIDGPLWFLGALLICGAHALYLRSWQRERRQHQAWWQKYDAKAQQRHEEFMSAIGRDEAGTRGWNLDGNRERGQA